MDNVSSVLKAFVIAGGIALLAGTILLVVLLMLRLGGGDAAAPAAVAGAVVDLALPAGARIEQMVVDGSRLVLLAADPDGRQYLAVVNGATGERLSLIRVKPAE